MLRRSSMFNRTRIEHLRQRGAAAGAELSLHYADLTDHTTLRRIIQRVQPGRSCITSRARATWD